MEFHLSILLDATVLLSGEYETAIDVRPWPSQTDPNFTTYRET